MAKVTLNPILLIKGKEFIGGQRVTAQLPEQPSGIERTRESYDRMNAAIPETRQAITNHNQEQAQ